jgi:molecular chaperone HtpG
MRTRKRGKEEKRKKNVTAVAHQWELANKNKALWTHLHSEVTGDEHGEFSKTLTNDWEKHLSVKHFSAEVEVGFTVLLFVPEYVIYDLLEPKEEV